MGITVGAIIPGRRLSNELMTTGLKGPDSDASLDRAKVLFGSNYPRLQTLKRKYDPEVIFKKWFAIRPASAEL